MFSRPGVAEELNVGWQFTFQGVFFMLWIDPPACTGRRIEGGGCDHDDHVENRAAGLHHR